MPVASSRQPSAQRHPIDASAIAARIPALAWPFGLMTVAALGALAGVPVFRPDLAGRIALPLIGASLVMASLIGLLAVQAQALGRVLRWAGLLCGLVLAAAGIVNPLKPSQDGELIRLAERFGSADQSYSDSALGVIVGPARGWVILKPGHGLGKGDEPPLAMIEPTRAGVAFLQTQNTAIGLNLDQAADRLVAARQRELATFREKAREDLQIGSTKGRLISSSWVRGQRYLGWTAIWLDGPHGFTLSVALPVQPDSQALAMDLIRSVRFDAPFEKSLAATVERVSAESALLTPDAARFLTRILPMTAATEQFFREGYSRAMRGLPHLEPSTIEETRSVMQVIFASLGPQRQALGAYVERIRANGATTAEEDRAMSQIMNSAIRRLKAEQQEKLRKDLQRAIERTLGAV